MERQVAVAAIHRTAGGIDQVLHTVMAAIFKDVARTHKIALDVGRWILQRITNTRLCCQVDHHPWLLSRKQSHQRFAILLH